MRGKEYDLKKLEDEYCANDVKLLAQAVMKFRDVSVKRSHVDPLTQCNTLASYTFRVYLQEHMIPYTVGSLPSDGYRKKQNNSEKCMKWFHCLRVNKAVANWSTFRCCAHPEGEKVIGGHKVDGYDSDTNRVYEFQGCFFHGCSKCYPNGDTVNKVCQKTLRALFNETTQKKEMVLKAGYSYFEMWEHGFDNWSELEFELCKGIEFLDFEHIIPMNIRDTMFGGRCGPLKLFVQRSEGETIHYVDINRCTRRARWIRIFWGILTCRPVLKQTLIGTSW